MWQLQCLTLKELPTVSVTGPLTKRQKIHHLICHINTDTVDSVHLNGAIQLSSCVNNQLICSKYTCWVSTMFGHVQKLF